MNDQLVSHIRQRLVQNVSHDDITKELTDAGWQIEDINTAFSVAQSTPQPQPPVVEVAEQSVTAPVVQDTNSAETYSAPINMSATAAPTISTVGGGAEGATAPQTDLPSVFSLLKGGFAIYKDRLGVLVSIGVIQLVIKITLAITIPIVSVVVLSFFLTNLITAAVITVVVAFLVGIGIIWLLYWSILAGLQAVRGHKEKVTFQTSFGSASHLVWSFLWLSISIALVLEGGIFIFSILPSAILALLGFLSPIALIIPGIYFVISIIISVSLFGTWFVFSYWVFLTEKLHGIHALMASRELVRGRFWQIFGRTFLIFSIIGIAVWIFHKILALTPSFIPIAVSIISMAVVSLFFVPFLLATMYFFYEQVRFQVPVIPQPISKMYKIFILYAVTGVIAVIILTGITPVALSYLNHARQFGKDAIIRSDVRIMQTQLVIVGGAAPGIYPLSLNEVTQSDPNIATLLQRMKKNGMHYVYQSTGSTYTFCVTLSNGNSQFCGDQTGKSFTK